MYTGVHNVDSEGENTKIITHAKKDITLYRSRGKAFQTETVLTKIENLCALMLDKRR